MLQNFLLAIESFSIYIIFFCILAIYIKERKIVWIKVYYAKLFMSRETSKVFVAGSNANLLSKELGTFLTLADMSLWNFILFLSMNFETKASSNKTRYILCAEGKVLLLSEIQKYLGIGNFHSIHSVR